MAESAPLLNSFVYKMNNRQLVPGIALTEWTGRQKTKLNYEEIISYRIGSYDDEPCCMFW